MKNMTRISSSIFLCLLSCIGVFILLVPVGPLAAGQDTSGKVIEVRDGRLTRLSMETWVDMPKGSEVSLGDRLKTDKSALAIIEAPKMGRFVIGPASEIELGRGPKEFKTSLVKGAAWLNARFPKGSVGTLSTPLVTAGVRGTRFSVFYGNGTKDVCICTCEGEVEATHKDGTKVTVPKGTVLVALGDGPAPKDAVSAMPYLEKGKTGVSFCFTCHIPGGKGKLISR